MANGRYSFHINKLPNQSEISDVNVKFLKLKCDKRLWRSTNGFSIVTRFHDHAYSLYESIKDREMQKPKRAKSYKRKLCQQT